MTAKRAVRPSHPAHRGTMHGSWSGVRASGGMTPSSPTGEAELLAFRSAPTHCGGPFTGPPSHLHALPRTPASTWFEYSKSACSP
jgi:hypothetical protein